MSGSDARFPWELCGRVDREQQSDDEVEGNGNGNGMRAIRSSSDRQPLSAP
jgi:hypothetical protein